jgi:hypothetical protein
MTAYATVEQLAAALRIRVTAENTDSLQSKLDATAVEIDQYLDRPAEDPLPDPPPAGVVEANILMAVDGWKAADAAFGVIGFEQIGAIRVSPDQIARVEGLLVPYKVRWAVA